MGGRWGEARSGGARELWCGCVRGIGWRPFRSSEDAGDEGFAGVEGVLIDGREGDVDAGRVDLGRGGAAEAVVADGLGFVADLDEMTVEAAGDGAVFVEAAGAGGGVDDGAGVAFVAGEEPLLPFVVRAEEAGGGVAGEIGFDALPELAGALLNIGADGGGGGEAAAVEAGGVLERDGEQDRAAFAAAGAAGDPFAGLGVGLGDGGVDGSENHQVGGGVEGH